MNTEIANNKVEIYTNRLFELADQYVEERLEGDEGKLTKLREFLFFACDRLERPNNDIDALDNLFSAYVRLCTKYDKMPTIEGFSFLTGINRSTFDDWKNKRYRSSDERYVHTIKTWYDVCKAFVVDELSNNPCKNVNLIFVAKAAYGLYDSPSTPIPVEEVKPAPKGIDQLPTIEELEAARLEGLYE